MNNYYRLPVFKYTTYQSHATAMVRNACILLVLLFLVGCKPWADPIVEITNRSQKELKQLAKAEQGIASLQDKNTHIQLDSLLTWTFLLKNTAESEALIYTREAARIATEANKDEYQAMARYYIALLEGRQQLFSEGLAEPLMNAQISHRLWQSTEYTKWKVLSDHLLGDLFYRQEEYDSASFYFNLAYDQMSQVIVSDDWLSIKGSVFHGLGAIAKSKKDYQQADSLYQMAEELYKQVSDFTALSRLLQEKSAVKTKEGKTKEAIYFLDQSTVLAKQAEDVYTLSGNYQRLGNLYMRKYRKDKDTINFHISLNYFNQSLRIQKENFFYTYRRIGKLMQSRANRDLDRTDYVDSSLVYYKIAFEKAREEGALNYFKKLSKDISGLCEWLFFNRDQDCTEILGTSASEYLNNNYSAVVDTITQDIAQANEHLLLFEQQQQTAKNQRKIINQWLISGLGLIMAAFIFIILFQQQKQKRLQARMEALRAQINPHFFSNSLNAIESLVNLDQRKAASKYLIHFSRLTRRVLNSSLEATTNLSGELETTKHFLALEQLRFKDKLDYQIEIAEDIVSAEVAVPALLFQPYLENAIWHGIKPKEDPSLLRIKIHRQEGKLICIIEDDGVGREQARKLQQNSVLQKKSVGMKITKERLLSFGGGKVDIVDLYDEDGMANGTRVILEMPYRKYKRKLDTTT